MFSKFSRKLFIRLIHLYKAYEHNKKKRNYSKKIHDLLIYVDYIILEKFTIKAASKEYYCESLLKLID